MRKSTENKDWTIRNILWIRIRSGSVKLTKTQKNKKGKFYKNLNFLSVKTFHAPCHDLITVY